MCSRNRQMASRSTIALACIVVARLNPSSSRAARIRRLRGPPGRPGPHAAGRGRGAFAADGGSEGGHVGLVEIASVLGFDLALTARIAEQDGAQRVLDH